MFERLAIQVWEICCSSSGDLGIMSESLMRLKCRRHAAHVQETCGEFGIFHHYFFNPGNLRLMSGRLAV